ncbi:MAG: hypothetical protein PHG06_00430 [Parabacteroides sp.]|nr:hypothetical protein [Parabacteroides sp.]
MTQIKTFLDGNSYCATYEDFINLQVSPAGFGNNPEDATEALLKETLMLANTALTDIKSKQDYAEGMVQRVKSYVLSSEKTFKVDFATVSYRPSTIQTKIDKAGILKLAETNDDVKKCVSEEASKATTAISWK